MGPAQRDAASVPAKNPINAASESHHGGYLDMELHAVLRTVVPKGENPLVGVAITYSGAIAIVDKAASERHLSPFDFNIRSVKVGEIIPA